MSVSVTVSLGELVSVDVSTDASYSPDVAEDILTRARDAALYAFATLGEHDSEQP